MGKVIPFKPRDNMVENLDIDFPQESFPVEENLETNWEKPSLRDFWIMRESFWLGILGLTLMVYGIWLYLNY